MCQFDAFDSYGTGNSVVGVGLPYSTLNGTTSATQTAADTLLMSNTGGTNNAYGISRHWGVSGGSTTPDFVSGYSNKNTVKIDLVNVSTGDLDVYFGISFAPASPATEQNCIRIYKSGGANSAIDFEFREAAGLGALLRRVVSISTGVTDANLYKTYQIEYYDGTLKGSPWAAFEFEWKILINGVIVAESLTGATRNHGKMSIGYAAVPADYWCVTPIANIYQDSVSAPSIAPSTTWDNLGIGINGDVACIP